MGSSASNRGASLMQQRASCTRAFFAAGKLLERFI
jgi:hypothetical protein